jgi:hypothetical protein
VTEILARVVPPGWEVSVDLGSGMRLLFYPDPSEIRFAHVCDRGERGIIVCAPMLTEVNLPGGHQVSGPRLRPTVSPSILCPDCATHGWVTDGRWVPS